MQLLVGTSNTGKVLEITECLSHLPIEIVTPESIGLADTLPEETGSTYAENAAQKALYYFQKTNIPTVADDSGIVIEALANELGVHTRRWGAGPQATDEEWITFFLHRMQQEQNTRAYFICALAYIDKTGSVEHFKGTCRGTITKTVEAPYLPGLPLSGCFVPEGYSQVFSALSTADKNTVSHRGKALQLYAAHLANQLQ